jgi:NADH dehydrogenase FAD-containing subunit
MGTVSGVDETTQTVRLGEQTLHFDILILATGAMHSYFEREDRFRFAPGLKRIDDATTIRSGLLSAFERAKNEQIASRVKLGLHLSSSAAERRASNLLVRSRNWLISVYTNFV